MASAGFRLDTKEARAKLSLVRQGMSNMKTPFSKSAIVLDRWVQKNFKEQGALAGGWEPFKIGGRMSRNGLDSSAQLLQDTGHLKASFIPWATNKNAGIGSELDYAEAHEKGTGNLPARRMLPTQKDVGKPIKKIFTAHVNNVIKRVF